MQMTYEFESQLISLSGCMMNWLNNTEGGASGLFGSCLRGLKFNSVVSLTAYRALGSVVVFICSGFDVVYVHNF